MGFVGPSMGEICFGADPVPVIFTEKSTVPDDWLLFLSSHFSILGPKPGTWFSQITPFRSRKKIHFAHACLVPFLPLRRFSFHAKFYFLERLLHEFQFGWTSLDSKFKVSFWRLVTPLQIRVWELGNVEQPRSMAPHIFLILISKGWEKNEVTDFYFTHYSLIL